MKKIVMFLIAGLFLIGGMSNAHAFLGTFYTPVPSAVPAYTTLVATTGLLPFSITYQSQTISGNAISNVYMNTTGLLFEYNVAMDTFTSNQGVGTFSEFFFDGFPVDAGYDPAKNPTPLHNPSVAKNPAGTVYVDYSQTLNSGEQATVYLQTTAQYYTGGNFDVLGWGTYDFKGFQPTATPEPATVMLLSTGLLGLLGFRRKMGA